MSESEAPTVKGSPWNKVFWLFALLIVAGLIVFLSFIWIGKQSIDKTAETVKEIFNPREVVQTFYQWRELQVEGNDGNILEVATAGAVEEFTRKTNFELFGKVMPLGTTVSEISVPAVYRFHIDLNGEWFVEADGSRLMVIAPKLQPSLPVAFDTGGMQKKTKSGWGRWDGDENLETLEREITSKLNQRAGDEKTLSKAREKARVSVAKFLKTWLVNQEMWANDRFEEIVVVFEDEEGASLMSREPALELESEPLD